MPPPREHSQGSRNGRTENHGRTSDLKSNESEPDNKEVLIYTQRDGRNIELSTKSLKSLAPGTYLNDEIILFYTSYLITECCALEMSKRMHVFDSLFHELLRDMFGDKDKTSKKDKDKEQDKTNDGSGDQNNKKKEAWSANLWAKVNNWVNSVDIFEKDFLIIPVCHEHHWFAIIVCYPNEVCDCDAKHSHPEPESSLRHRPVPGILILDSLDTNLPEQTKEVRYFLDFEWRTRCSVVKDFFYHNLKQFKPKLPKQTNNSDCGIFMLAYLKAFVQQPKEFYRLARLSHREEDLTRLTELINTSLTHCGREAIKSLIHRQCKILRR